MFISATLLENWFCRHNRTVHRAMYSHTNISFVWVL